MEGGPNWPGFGTGSRCAFAVAGPGGFSPAAGREEQQHEKPGSARASWASRPLAVSFRDGGLKEMFPVGTATESKYLSTRVPEYRYLAAFWSEVVGKRRKSLSGGDGRGRYLGGQCKTARMQGPVNQVRPQAANAGTRDRREFGTGHVTRGGDALQEYSVKSMCRGKGGRRGLNGGRRWSTAHRRKGSGA